MKTKPKSVLYKQIDMLCIQSDTSIAKLAQKLGTTPQNLYTRLQRGKMTYEEIEAIANALGYSFSYNFQLIQKQTNFHDTEE